MIISVDTNILIQASIVNGRSRKVLLYVNSHEKLVLSKIVLEEYSDVINRKSILDKYNPINILELLNYEVIETSKDIDSNLFFIRDIKDYPVLYSVINSDVEIFVTNDKDFDDVVIQKPIIMTSEKYYEEFMQ